MRYKDLEAEAIEQQDAVRKQDAVELIKEKRAELIEAQKVVRRLEFEYNELLESDIE